MIIEINDVESLLILEGLKLIQKKKDANEVDSRLSNQLRCKILEVVNEAKKRETHNDI